VIYRPAIKNDSNATRVGVSLEDCQCFSPEIEALRLYPPFYPPMESFGHYLSARQIMLI
jgi:hypothetical protein